MSRKAIHVLYEHGVDQRPFGSAYIRLLRPLTHPELQSGVSVTCGLTYEGQAVDAVVVDRLWQPDISPVLAANLIKQVQTAGAKLIYAIDDNLLALPQEKKDWEPTDTRLEVVRMFLTEAEGVIVTTPALKKQFARFNSNIVIIPNALDERLLPLPRASGELSHLSSQGLNRFLQFLKSFRLLSKKKKIIGYMGTLTHDDDLMMILPALRTIATRYSREIEFQIIGAIRQPGTRQALKELPCRVIFHKLKKIEYPQFMPWFSRLHWDIALAPLKETPFNGCKSDIKFLDYCALGAAGIYSCVPAYQNSVRHLETGWLAENNPEAWVAPLERLLIDDPFRVQMAQNAVRYLFKERVIASCGSVWLKALEDLLNKSEAM